MEDSPSMGKTLGSIPSTAKEAGGKQIGQGNISVEEDCHLSPPGASGCDLI